MRGPREEAGRSPKDTRAGGALTQTARLGAAPEPVGQALPDVRPHERVARVAGEDGGGAVRRLRPDLVAVGRGGQAPAGDNWKENPKTAALAPACGRPLAGRHSVRLGRHQNTGQDICRGSGLGRSATREPLSCKESLQGHSGRPHRPGPVSPHFPFSAPAFLENPAHSCPEVHLPDEVAFCPLFCLRQSQGPCDSGRPPASTGPVGVKRCAWSFPRSTAGSRSCGIKSGTSHCRDSREGLCAFIYPPRFWGSRVL